jgi:hemerythrin superfamily protein
MPRAQRTKTAHGARSSSSHAREATQGGRDYTSRAIQMLTADHENVKRLLRQGERAEDDTDRLQAIVDEACDALTAHAEIEEEFFYPALRETDARELVAEAEVEHNAAKQLITDLQGMGADDERYRATFNVLGEYVKHHINEEENEIFPLARASNADFEPLFEALSAQSGDGEDAADDEDGAHGAHGAETSQSGTPKRSRRVARTARSGR